MHNPVPYLNHCRKIHSLIFDDYFLKHPRKRFKALWDVTVASLCPVQVPTIEIGVLKKHLVPVHKCIDFHLEFVIYKGYLNSLNGEHFFSIYVSRIKEMNIK